MKDRPKGSVLHLFSEKCPKNDETKQRPPTVDMCL